MYLSSLSHNIFGLSSQLKPADKIVLSDIDSEDGGSSLTIVSMVKIRRISFSVDKMELEQGK